jgi:TonB-dependent receptor
MQKVSAKLRLPGLLLAGTSLVALGNGTALASDQSSPAQETAGNSTAQTDAQETEAEAQTGAAAQAAAEAEGDTIVVTGIRRSLRNALQTKRNTEVISDNISSEEIGQLPDVTIAEEINRLPGANTTRDRGNASYVTLRGLGPRFVFGLVNGREVASSEPSQDMRYETFPSEMLSGVQIYKSQEASLIPGGIAGTIDIRTVRPLEYRGPAFSVRFGPLYNEGGENLPDYNPWGYRGSAGFIKQLTDDLAIALAVSAQQQKTAYPDFRTWGWNTIDSGLPGDVDGDGSVDNTTWGLNTETKNLIQTRKGLVANLGWRLSDELTLNVDSLFSRYNIWEDSNSTWFANNVLGNWDGGNNAAYRAPGSSVTIENGTVVAATLPGSNPNYQSQIARYTQRQDLITLGANLEWIKGPLEISFDVSRSQAKRDGEWRAVYLADQFGTGISYDVRGVPTATVMHDATAPWDPSIQYVSPARLGAHSGPVVAKDHINAVALDVRHELDDPGFSAIQFGARMSERVKKGHAFDFPMCPGVGSVPRGTTAEQCAAMAGAGRIDLGQYLYNYEIPQFGAPPMVWGDWDELWNLVYPDDSIPANGENILARTRLTAKTLDAYAKLGIDAMLGQTPITGGVGVRVSHYKSTSDGMSTRPDGTVGPLDARNEYTDVLPSLNLTAHLTDRQLLRLGAAIAISRPPLDILGAGVSFNRIEPGRPPTASGGNPFLKPFKSKQIDISYENYFHEEALFAIAPYYKRLSTFIGFGQDTIDYEGVTYQIGTSVNGEGGDVYGFETTFQTPFYFLPGVLKNFGIYSNYTFAETNIREFTPASNPFVMTGLAKHSFVIEPYFASGPFEARLSYKYHSPFVAAPTWNGLSLKELAPETLIDASLSYQLTENIGVRFHARNLTNERLRWTSDNNRSNLSNDQGYQIYGRSYLLDVSFRM